MSRALVIIEGPKSRAQAAFWGRCEPDPNSGCWLWSGTMSSDGYGVTKPPGLGRRTRAHRWALALSGVEVPPDAVVMHRCDTPLCVNPAHLSVGTHADNIADKVAKGRARGPTGQRWKLPEGSRSGANHSRFGKRKTHCKSGHAFTPENTRLTTKGSQCCRTCEREKALRSYHRRRAS